MTTIVSHRSTNDDYQYQYPSCKDYQCQCQCQCQWMDSYFGAMLNSMIHVMMYSYYALALFKIPCPWKRFLTQAQLGQFTSVVIYSIVCIAMWGEKRGWKEVTCIAIQVGEMTSLFVLFARFYKKSYSKKSKKSEDECSKAMGAISTSATEGLKSAAKSASKVM